jgi:hypothetical protein
MTPRNRDGMETIDMHGTRNSFVGMARRMGVCAIAVAWLVSSASCGYLNKNGRSPVYLVIDSLAASSGAKPDSFGTILESDVVTNVKTQVNGQDVLVPTVYEDLAKVSLHVALKDPGTINSVTSPTAANAITVTSYHVEFKRSDGRNTPGVDVPYAFDGGATGTFNALSGSIVIVLVRGQAKLEAPLKAMAGGGGAIIISTIADVTLYGRDQNGNDVSVTGSISVNFADWGDPS